MPVSIMGKKLLILGGNTLSCDIVVTARKMGVHTIVIDWFDDFRKSPAKSIADEHRLISVADVDAVVDLIKREGIDGILTGFTDSILHYYQKICEKAELPCYASKEQIEIMTDKSRFKELCKKFSIPVPKDYYLQAPLTKNDFESLEYPVIIKPIDNSGGKGIVIAQDKESFLQGFEYARSHSHKGDVVVEQYLEDGDHFTASYTMADGAYALSAMYDRIMNSEQEVSASMCTGSRHPSKFIRKFLDQVDPHLQMLMRAIGLTNGTMTFQGVVHGNAVYIYDPIFRLSGDQFYKFTEIQNGTNTLCRLIRFAITGEMMGENDSLEKDNPFFSKPCVNLCINIKPGTILRMSGLEELVEVPGVFHIVQNFFEGDTIAVSNRQAWLKIKICAPTVLTLTAAISEVFDTIRIISDTGEDMLMKQLKADEFGSTNNLMGTSVEER